MWEVPKSAPPWLGAQPRLRSHWRWWRQARPRSEIRGQPASESSRSESASWWRRPRHQSSTWGQHRSDRDWSSLRATAGGEGSRHRGPCWSLREREGAQPCPPPPLPAPPRHTLLTEVVQALVVDGTAAGVNSLYRHLPELPELTREATPIWPHPLLVLKPGRGEGECQQGPPGHQPLENTPSPLIKEHGTRTTHQALH